jgi:transcriptional regulator with XRE-family HTH domain
MCLEGIQMEFKQYLEKKYLEWQNREGGRKTITEFADFLGISQPTISNYMTGARKPDTEKAMKIANKLGIEVYDVLGIPRPDLEYYFTNAPPHEVNAQLRNLLDRIIITKTGTPQLIWS